MLDGIFQADFVDMSEDVSKFVYQIYPYSFLNYFCDYLGLMINHVFNGRLV